MDIIDRVFENLNIGYDADRERTQTAKLRQKESQARRNTRLGIFGGIVAVLAAGVGLAVWLPNIGGQTAANSDIKIVFNEDEQPVIDTITVAADAADAAEVAEENAEEGEAAEEAVAEENTEVVTNTVRGYGGGAASTSRQTVTSTGTKTEVIVHTIDSGEKIDQGDNDCQAVSTGSTGVVLWCSNSTAAPTEENVVDEPEQSGEDEENEDDGASGVEAQ